MELQNQHAVIRHYDALIDEGNDPVLDPAPLRRHMDGWDGDWGGHTYPGF